MSMTHAALFTFTGLILALITLQRIFVKAAAEQRRRQRLLDYLAAMRRRNDGRI